MVLVAVRIWEGGVRWNTAANFNALEVRNLANIFVSSANLHLQLKSLPPLAVLS